MSRSTLHKKSTLHFRVSRDATSNQCNVWDLHCSATYISPSTGSLQMACLSWLSGLPHCSLPRDWYIQRCLRPGAKNSPLEVLQLFEINLSTDFLKNRVEFKF